MKKEEFLSCLEDDLSRFEGKTPNLIDLFLKNEIWYIWNFIKELRYVEYYESKKGLLRLLYYLHFIRYKRLSFKLHFTIYPGSVGPGFRIYHVGGFTHVGKNVKIGRNCTILPGVVFGNKTEVEDNRPVIVGDNCYIGLNAKIFGPVVIGNNVTIGANAVITKDIPDNVIVGGIPAKIIKYKDEIK